LSALRPPWRPGGRNGEIRQEDAGQGSQSDAREKGRQASQRRLAQEGDEPQAGDRDRAVRGAARGRQGAPEPEPEVRREEVDEEVVSKEVDEEIECQKRFTEDEREKVVLAEIDGQEIDEAIETDEEVEREEIDEEVRVAEALVREEMTGATRREERR
jgi:hypothetical protein